MWVAKYRLPDGRQVQRKIGPAWTERGRPPAGYFTKRTAEAWLRSILDEARRDTLSGMVRTGATFADAAAEWLRYCETERNVKPSTLTDYRSNINAHYLPVFGERRLEDITAREIERWLETLGHLTPRSRNKLLTVMHGIFRRAQKVWGLPVNPRGRHREGAQPIDGRSRGVRTGGGDGSRPRRRLRTGRRDLPDRVHRLRRGELVALRWRDVDFTGATIRVRASYAAGSLTSPKSGKVRSVPMAPDVAKVLAALGQRALSTSDDDLVFVGDQGFYLDASALRRRLTAALGRAGLRPLGFHDLRHTFGTRMIAVADIRRVQEWMGHADIQTTIRYLHYAPRGDEADLVSKAFQIVPAAVDAPDPSRARTDGR